MKRILSLSLLLLLTFALLAAKIDTTVGKPVFPSFTAKSLDGQSITQDIFKGHKVTMVNIWGTFCTPCIKEMPFLGNLAQKYEDQGFQIVGMIIDVNESLATSNTKKLKKAQEIIASTGADYLHLIPSKSLNNLYLESVMSVPETIFVDEDGNRIGQSYVGSRDEKAWEEIIVAMLESRN